LAGAGVKGSGFRLAEKKGQNAVFTKWKGQKGHSVGSWGKGWSTSIKKKNRLEMYSSPSPEKRKEEGQIRGGAAAVRDGGDVRSLGGKVGARESLREHLVKSEKEEGYQWKLREGVGRCLATREVRHGLGGGTIEHPYCADDRQKALWGKRAVTI